MNIIGVDLTGQELWVRNFPDFPGHSAKKLITFG
jgi:hypothetical protein